MFKRPPWKPKWLARVNILFRGQLLPMGTVGDVRRELDRLFPNLRWEQPDVQRLVPSLPSLHSLQGPVWFGFGSIEVQLSADESGQVTNFQLSRAGPAEMRKLEKAMGLVAFDLQRESMLGIIFG
jgi:hypothetical protein